MKGISEVIKKEFYVVNSFAAKSFQGNPAAIFLNGTGLNETIMQSIARQLNLVETVFVAEKESDSMYDFEFKYFTPIKEVPIAGHPTIAAFIAIEAAGLINVTKKEVYLIKTNAGIQKVKTYKKENDLIVMMEAKKPVFYPIVLDRYEVARALGLDICDFIEELPIQPIDTGLGHVIIPVKSLSSLMKAKRNIIKLNELCMKLKVREVQIFTFDTFKKELDIHTRNLCPREGIEDPGCGVGNAALGAYLLENRYTNLQEITIKAEQGIIVNMPCIIDINAYKRNDGIEVQVGGTGTLMIKGEFFVE